MSLGNNELNRSIWEKKYGSMIMHTNLADSDLCCLCKELLVWQLDREQALKQKSESE